MTLLADPPTLQIRPAVRADFDALCALWAEVDDLHRRARPELFRAPEGPGRDPAWFERVIDWPDSEVLVAQAPDGRIDGLAVLLVRKPSASGLHASAPFVEIDNLVVAPGARRQGVGRALMEAARAWTAARGLARLELNVYEFNEAAQSFYEAERFSTLSRRMSLNV